MTKGQPNSTQLTNKMWAYLRMNWNRPMNHESN